MKTVGQMVAEARERAGYRSKKAFADDWGRDPSFVSRLEGGKVIETLPPEDMRRLRDLLGLRVSDLLAASGYELEDVDAETHTAITEIEEHARLVDWERDPARLPVMHAIMETWSRFDRNSLRMVAEASPDYDDDGQE